MSFTYAVALTCALCSPVHVTGAYAQAVVSWTEKQLGLRIERYAFLTPEGVAKIVDVADDDLEPAATLSTERVFVFKGGLTDRVRADTFFRAIVGKQTGATVYQLYARLRYSGEMRRFTVANYDDGGQPTGVPLIVADRRVECLYGNCGGIEDVAFTVPEETMRALAMRAAERPVQPWRVRFKAENGQDWTDDIAPAEAAGLLIAVDRYRRDHKLQ
ncbi:hypothetical protein [Sphingomonas baiyangensis]|uniref:Uncharacterized protein n=1 Tax=Sphingomonas baiyangensis TaxID=2572576 RepID=A0A4U1L5H5_9SPHN|nr:hypothetical protein [Sphingomonas baiyangensis]TKD51520.1 hypothetical protein FBR43_12720 [Sphingomonas baiyangensis]